MPANRRRHVNAVPIASLATWVVVAAFVCATGLGYVHCKNGLHASGRHIKTLERELAELIKENEVVRTNVAKLSSRAVLQRRLSEGFIQLIPITDDRIVRIGPGPKKSGEIALRPVANERMQE
ncbi:MAG: hypothetical protein M3463_12580 [Verrucomicrobiota bacterium]|nr:hypothetical protein [Verrucomicrobiota bacterium]